jgi:hypothetical protein
MTAGMDRRRALQILASIPFASVFTFTGVEIARAQQAVRSGFTRQFFTDHEHRTVRVLVDLILPRDERSGSATEARVPEFLDFMMVDQPERQVAKRGGLAWMDLECGERFGKVFVDCSAEQQAALLDLLAWPERAPESSPKDRSSAAYAIFSPLGSMAEATSRASHRLRFDARPRDGLGARRLSRRRPMNARIRVAQNDWCSHRRSQVAIPRVREREEGGSCKRIPNKSLCRPKCSAGTSPAETTTSRGAPSSSEKRRTP